MITLADARAMILRLLADKQRRNEPQNDAMK
jgi:hypothetical protein